MSYLIKSQFFLPVNILTLYTWLHVAAEAVYTAICAIPQVEKWFSKQWRACILSNPMVKWAQILFFFRHDVIQIIYIYNVFVYIYTSINFPQKEINILKGIFIYVIILKMTRYLKTFKNKKLCVQIQIYHKISRVSYLHQNL